MNKRKGISLIVLVITILVMIILAGVVVVSLQKNNPIEKAKTAKDTSNLSALKEELELYKTNELMLGNKDANNISFTETEAKDILKNIPENLKEKVVVSNGKLGVYYSKITEEAQDYARENDIFDAEDKIAPDADIYVETIGGRKYITVDAVDYETDISQISCNNGKVKKINSKYGKVGYRIYKGSLTYDDMLIKEIENKVGKTEEIPMVIDNSNKNIFKDYDVLILNGGFYYSYLGPNEDVLMEELLIDFLNNSTKERPKMIITMGNDSQVLTVNHPLFKSSRKAGGKAVYNLAKNPNVDNIVTRQLETWVNEHPNSKEDYITYVEMKKSSNITEYYTDLNAPSPLNGNIAMYQNKENGSAWLHMSNSPHYVTHYMKPGYARSIIAGLNKGTGTRSMSVDVTEVTPGTKYSFTVTDLAGNKIIKEITL